MNALGNNQTCLVMLPKFRSTVPHGREVRPGILGSLLASEVAGIVGSHHVLCLDRRPHPQFVLFIFSSFGIELILGGTNYFVPICLCVPSVVCAGS